MSSSPYQGGTGLGFHERLLISLIALALGAAGLQLFLGYWSFQRALDQDLLQDLTKYAALVEAAIELESPEPRLDPGKLPGSSELQGRFRLLKDGRVVLEGGGPFPQGENPRWLLAQRALPEGYVLEVALNQAEHHRALEEYLRTGWFSLLLSAGLALGVAWILGGYLVQPLRRLLEATKSLAEQRFPAPLPEGGLDELGQLTRSFNRMVQKLRLALERERSFTRYASHELRNPLANLKTTLAAVQGGAMPLEELLPILERNLSRMDQILSGLLALARGPEGASWIEMQGFLEEIVSTFPTDRIRLEAAPFRLQAPREALGAAIRNLLENALKHGEGQVWISFHPTPPRLVVRDQGKGVPPEALERLGQPFFRVNAKGDGLGLGLAFVRQVMEAMGGRLELRNHPEGGLEAVLLFPGGSHA